MPVSAINLLKTFAVAGVCLSLAACELPRGGPRYDELVGEEARAVSGLEVVAITDRVAAITSDDSVYEFSRLFQTAAQEDIEIIRPGDTLDITIWENTDVPLYGTGGLEGTANTILGDIRVSQNGKIFVPQIGQMDVGGKTVEGFRRYLTNRLSEMTPDPQVELRLTVSGANTVKVFGDAGVQGNFPIEVHTRTLTGLLAEAGGVSSDPAITMVQLRRGAQVGSVWLSDLYNNPQADIALKGGDVISIKRDERSFTALGAFGAQTHVQFEGRDLTLLKAIGGLGGLNQALADPKGIFVLRNESPQIYNEIIPGARAVAPKRVAYIADITRPGAMFTISEFDIRDGDLLYVTEAPYTQWMKILGSISPPITTIQSTTSLLTGQ